MKLSELSPNKWHTRDIGECISTMTWRQTGRFYAHVKAPLS
ncbi:MAG: hypothetical protein VX608_00530 [Chloroflexota bacterium]|nr:hypothetical protein [Chloroflexota bacterium]